MTDVLIFFFFFWASIVYKSIEFSRLYVSSIGKLLVNDEMEQDFYQNTHIWTDIFRNR